VKAQLLNSKSLEIDELDWDSEFTKIQVLNDMILVQQFIFEKFQSKSLNNDFVISEDFPSLDCTLKDKKNNCSKFKGSKDLIKGSNILKHQRYNELYNESINNYFYHESQIQLSNDNIKNWQGLIDNTTGANFKVS
jgi:hypothetical protein